MDQQYIRVYSLKEAITLIELSTNWDPKGFNMITPEDGSGQNWIVGHDKEGEWFFRLPDRETVQQAREKRIQLVVRATKLKP